MYYDILSQILVNVDNNKEIIIYSRCKGHTNMMQYWKKINPELYKNTW